MARTVFITGAGTSCLAGAPLTSQFLRAIRDLYANLPDPSYKHDFEVVLKGYQLLQPVYAKLRMNYEKNIEDLFATFEMARILETDIFGGLNALELTSSMKRVICATIEHNMLYALITTQTSSEGTFIRFTPQYYYLEFVHILNDLFISGRVDSSIAILTFNYDLGLDYALSFTRAPFGYNLSTDQAKGDIPLLKLHGSLNWATCQVCKKVVAYPLDEFVKAHPPDEGDPGPMLVSRHLTDLQHCGKPVAPEPFIVPPTWNKTEYHRTIADVWRAAVKELATATNIFICGYSIPSTDQFFRHLLALSLAKGEIVDRVVVINPDKDAYNNLQQMLSEPVANVLKYEGLLFEESYDQIRNNLHLYKQKREWEGVWSKKP